MARKVYKGTTVSLEFPYPAGYDSTYSYTVQAASVSTVLTGLTISADDSLKVEAPATATTVWAPASYRLHIRAEKGAEVFVFNCGYVQVLPSVFIDGAKAVDPDSNVQPPKTWREKLLVAAKQALLNAAGSGAISFSTDGGTTSFQTREELMSFIRGLEREIQSRRKGRRFRVYQV